MKPEQKSYYLTQAAYWCQQLLVLVLGLEKPRKDYNELVVHHIVTLWLVGCVQSFGTSSYRFITDEHVWYSWSYLINLTRIGTAVYISMDIPDAFLGVRASFLILVDEPLMPYH